MRWRNGPEGYGVVTRTLHWVTLLVLVVQFTVGYAMEVDDSGRGRGRGRGGESGRGRGRGGDDDLADSVLDGSFDLVDLHVLLASTVLVLVAVRLVWRATTPLPPWSERLRPRDRRLLTVSERTLLGLLVVIPVTGLLLLVDSDLLVAHVAAHVAFYVVLVVHVAVVTRRRVVHRMVTGRP